MSKKVANAFMEAEFAFRLRNPAKLSQVLEKLWPASGLIDLDGVMAARVGEGMKLSVHIFSTRTKGNAKERLRLSIDKNGLEAKLDRKRLVDRAKFEKPVERSAKKKDVLRLMKTVQPMVSVFCKERATLVYKFLSPTGQDRYVKIGVDRIVAIPLSASRSKGASFFDVDVEGDGTGSERQFAASTFFRSEVLAFLVPLEQSTAKWRVARTASRGATKDGKFRSYEDVFNFFTGCIKNFRRVFPDGHTLTGRSVSKR